MPLPVPPRRQPIETRQRLLDETAKIVLEKGLAGVTLEAVAKAAGVSKGGLLHHFHNKQQLIDALIIDLHQQFVERWQKIAESDPVETGRKTRAYLKVVTRERNEPGSKLCNIIAVEDRDNRTMKALWRKFLSSLLSSEQTGGADPITLAIVQLATDGLWLAEMEGILDATPEIYDRIVERLEQMTNARNPSDSR